jgi:hypothetical protein
MKRKEITQGYVKTQEEGSNLKARMKALSRTAPYWQP